MAWQPQLTWWESLRYALIPVRAERWYRAARARRRDEKELALLPYLVPRSRIALDIGANKGLYTYCLARLGVTVHAFEPNPKMFRLLTRDRPARVHAHACALGDKAGRAVLKIPHGSKGYSNQRGSLVSAKIGDDPGEVEVEVRTLDSFDFEPVGFIKLDVEGFERQVLAGGRDLITRDRPVLLIEIEEIHTGAPTPDIVAEVCAMGYRAFVLDQGVLTAVDRLDLADHNDPFDRAHYLYNFIFLPAGGA